MLGADFVLEMAREHLGTGDTGMVIADLKPVWLMSPLSVSDTLPLDTGTFDVVIFDEASQIPVEEAVPALHRAPMTIVVGDRQQLPPTDFFSTKAEQTEDDDDPGRDDADDAALELDSDSFLTQAAGNLPGTLLSWHYRSRSETLISFSNAAFYDGRLLTIPDSAVPRVLPPIRIADATDGDANAPRVLERPIGFHLLDRSPYEDRRNPGEATYIARLVRALLKAETGQSIGIVAFSQAQQGQIETALADLATDDPDFASRYERELTREEDDQFCGLLVKNLENIQGDERDIIIVSICYGPDATGKMLMNFGPINKSGGERRLNVVFSRAKRHMVVVSSIRHTAITNEYNDGANCFRRYLEFSAAASEGDVTSVRRVLESYAPQLARPSARGTSSRGAVAEALATALKARGLDVAFDVGDSHFRCDLAVRRPGSSAAPLGLLVDTDAQYETTSPLERWVLRPELLRQAGWRSTPVLARDVQQDPDATVAGLVRLVASASE